MNLPSDPPKQFLARSDGLSKVIFNRKGEDFPGTFQIFPGTHQKKNFFGADGLLY